MTTSLDFTSPRSSLNMATKHVERRIKAGRGNTGPATLPSELLWLHSTSVIVHEADVQPRQTILAKVAPRTRQAADVLNSALSGVNSDSTKKQ
jgi:hypothetical protein